MKHSHVKDVVTALLHTGNMDNRVFIHDSDGKRRAAMVHGKRDADGKWVLLLRPFIPPRRVRRGR